MLQNLMSLRIRSVPLIRLADCNRESYWNTICSDQAHNPPDSALQFGRAPALQSEEQENY